MMGKSHALSGVVTGSLVATAAHLPPAQAVAFIGVTSVCSLLPDFDHPDAMLPRMFAWPGRALATIIARIFGHRTLTHSVLGVGVLGAGLAFIPRLPGFCYWAVILGCVTHILGDMLTVSGVPVLWPHKASWGIGFKRFRMRTGGHMEQLIVTPLLVVLAVGGIGLVVANG
jgi:inner membrane protein